MTGSSCTIVGAGLVGSLAALAMNNLGLKTKIIDKGSPKDSFTKDTRSLVLSYSSINLLSALDLWAEIEKSSVPIKEIRITDAGSFGTVLLKASDVGASALGWSCNAGLLLSRLHDAIQSAPLVESLWRTKFKRLVSNRGEVEIEVETDHQSIRLESGILIGADGTRSEIREALALPVETIDYDQSAIVSIVKTEFNCPETAFERFTEHGSIALIPTHSGNLVSVQCLATKLAVTTLNLSDREFLEMLEERFGKRLGQFVTCGPRRMHPVDRLAVKSLVSKRSVIIGSAANTLHPNAAQGLNLGFRDVWWLRQAIADNSDDFLAALGIYSEQRCQDHRHTGFFTDLLAQSFSSKTTPTRVARRMFMRLVEHATPIKRRFIAHGMGLLSIYD